MANVRVMLTGDGPRQIRQSEGVQSDLARRAQQIATAAGPGMEPRSNMGPTRARASVVTTTFEAKRAEASGRALTSAIDAGRG